MKGPLLIFDGDCRFCRRSVALLQAWAPLPIAAQASQDCTVAVASGGIDGEQAPGAVQYIDRSGRLHRAARAVLLCLAEHGAPAWPLALYERVPGMAWLAEWVYRLVARHRGWISRCCVRG
ncbi:MAG: DCC1-like thiol-disulfide oxidoreductase family protein [Candidatus Methylacidiphilales bacterium]|nr:DCC1-like thiol-disulfide oxidoreductase family protein [Candidatus Methylacidiphilales bacterium]